MLKLGLGIAWDAKEISIPIKQIQLAEDLGFDSVWCAEAYGSDAITPLAFIAGQTKKIRLGTSIAQLAARTPASCAMQFNTLDVLAGRGRAICGLGLSGPQIVEGWYGQPWGKPYYRMRDYVQIMKKIFARKEHVTHESTEISLPLPADVPGAMGVGKPLKSIMETNPNLPIWLGTGGESMVRLTAQYCDGWIPLGLTPDNFDRFKPWLDEGFARAGNGKSLKDFEIQSGAFVNVTEDVQSAIDGQKPFFAFYVGGMGHKDKNFHKDTMVARGYADEAERIQELFAAGKREEAAEVVPDEYVDDAGLFGPPERIKERLRRWADSPVTGLTLRNLNDDTMRLLADINRSL